MDIRIDISKANTAENKLYRGAGMVSGNNSSRLLLDYKYEAPERYGELLEHIFGADGIGVNHLKLEMGSDINSSSGTEPCVKRSEDEKADVRRGAGYQLAADVKAKYPDVTLDMLYWSEPAWVTAAADVYDARYRWYKETLIAAYETYGLVFDYVSVSRNERDIDSDWIKYIARRLKSETECPYDFSAIKIVAADEENAWWIAARMADDEELRNAVDIVGSHYTSHATEQAKLMSDRYGKELWFSEGSPPMTYSEGAARFDGSGLAGINGVLDIANRIVAMYPCGCMTLYEYQPVVSAYYDGVTFCHKQLITACEPWSGYYFLDSGYYMSLHFSRFFRKGWSFIDSACYNDSKVGGDGHALVDTVHSYMTACSPETGDYSTVIVNSTDKPLEYTITASCGKTVHIWETRGPDSGRYDENYFRHTGSISPEKVEDGYRYTITLKPYSLVTVSTLEAGEAPRNKYTSELMPLPYSDDLNYGDDIIAARGGAPKFTTDQGGAFEILPVDGGYMLTQLITPETKAMEWGGTPNPVTCFGDDRWYNYSVTARVKLVPSDKPEENYIGAGVRCFMTCSGNSGYSILLYENGTWKLRRNTEVVAEGSADISPYELNEIHIAAERGRVNAYINRTHVAQYDDDVILCAGSAALYSSYNRNMFAGFDVRPIGESYSIRRCDNTDREFEYLGEWRHNTMTGFADYKRSLSTGEAGAELILRFEGSGFAVFGGNGETELSVDIDGVTEQVKLKGCCGREIFLSRYGLSTGAHEVRIKVLTGTLNIDGAEIL